MSQRELHGGRSTCGSTQDSDSLDPERVEQARMRVGLSCG
jgi:hypothetical protein